MKFFKVVSKIKFSNPAQNEIVILYPNDYWIRRLILKDLKSTTLPLYPVCIHVTPTLLIRTLCRMSRVSLLAACGENVFKNLLRQIYAQYILACIDQTRAKVVLTTIDNSSIFHYLSRLDIKRTYFAIQNGTRTLYCVRDALPAPPHIFSKISMSNFFCFGQREVELFSQCGHKIDRFLPIGSLIGGYYKSVVSKPPLIQRFDLCLISQWNPEFFAGADMDVGHAGLSEKVGRGLRDLHQYLARVLDETGLSLTICLRHDDKAEVVYFDAMFNGRAIYVKRDSNNFATYRAIEQSRLTVALNSTTLSEAFAWGQKVLWCNIHNNDINEMPEAGISYFYGDNYAAFKTRVLMIIGMDQSEYEEKTKERAHYINNYDPDHPPHEVIRSVVIQALASAV